MFENYLEHNLVGDLFMHLLSVGNSPGSGYSIVQVFLQVGLLTYRRKMDLGFFRRAMLGFMMMSKSDLEHWRVGTGHCSEKAFQILKVLHHASAIVSRGTVCWKTEIAGPESPDVGKECVVKECWRDHKVAPEFKLWEHANNKGILGCLDILASEDQDFAGVWKAFEAENQERRGMSSQYPTGT